MGATAGSLLDIMQVRMKMQETGIIHPNKLVVEATRILIEKLNGLDRNEEIEISIISREPLFAQYIRVKNREVLAEINVADFE